ncbi:MAG: oligosaccharide flippase family protein [Acidobacteria bacterium]|nr:oligosaccharide flippase family protein [Acidobacteriota bacterium]
MNPEPIAPDADIPQTRSPAAGMTVKVVKGTLWTLVGLMVPIFFSLFTTPLVTRLLGADGYGLFVLVLLIPTYFGFADFGMNVASTKFASAAFAEGGREREARIVRTSALIAFMSSLPPAAVMIIFARTIAEIANVPEHQLAEAAVALRLAGVIFVVNFLNSIFNTPELTRLRMDLNIWIMSGMRLLGLLVTPIVVYLGGGVIGAVIVALCVSLFTLASHLVVSARLLPEMLGFSIDRESIRPMIKFGGPLVISGIAGVLLINLEKFVLARVTSVETLAYYSIAAAFASMLTLFSGSMVQSLFPAFAQLQSEENRPALNTLYSRGIRLTLIWLVPVVVFMILAGRPFFTYWFSPVFGRESTGPFYITVLGLVFNVLAYFPYSVIMASGRSEIFAKVYWIELLPYILLVWLMASRFGASGAAAAWSLRVVFDTVFLFVIASRIGGVSYTQQHISAFLAAVAVMLIPLAAMIYFQGLNAWTILIAFAAAAVYGFIVLKRVLEKEEIAWVRNKLAVYLPK